MRRLCDAYKCTFMLTAVRRQLLSVSRTRFFRMSTQTIAVLNEQDLHDGQMKEVDFGDDGKVLLSRLGDKVHATSAFCTHYGAPLVKGTLAADGRVVCPWHGACFNVCTGDIEDAPAPDALHSFKAEISGGMIHVTAKQSDTLKANKSRSLTLRAQGYSTQGPGVVIVGGGAGALHTIESLRENGFEKSITVLSSEAYTPIDRTRLSKGLVTDASKLEYRSAADLKNKYGVTFRPGVTVTAVDPNAKYVVTESGEKITYENVVLATGGTPRRLPIPGGNLSNVLTLRHVEDAQKIDAALKEGQRLVVIGSSFISMELVVAVSQRKLASIDVVAMEDYPFERVLGAEVGKGLKNYHEKQGIKFHPAAKVSQIRASVSNPSLASGVELEGGLFLPADTVVAGVGVVPATQFLKSSGIPLERDGGVKVDALLRVPGFDGVYAVGDIAVYPESASGDWKRIEHWNVASNHGRAVGRTIIGKGKPFEKVPIFWSAQGSQLRYAGNGIGYEDVIIKGNTDELKFVAYYTKGEKVLAVASMQADPIVAKCSELLRLGLMPSASEIKAGKDPLTVDMSTTAAKVKA
ncbi:flavoprotein [Gautieria morchelliformis]|nr:flavoprotein [Gautieria morchelliformis]